MTVKQNDLLVLKTEHHNACWNLDGCWDVCFVIDVHDSYTVSAVDAMGRFRRHVQISYFDVLPT